MKQANLKEITERGIALKAQHRDLLWRQPNVWGVGVGFLQDAQGNRTGEVGIIVSVTERAAQDGLPVEDRIPESLDGIPVEIRDGMEPD